MTDPAGEVGLRPVRVERGGEVEEDWVAVEEPLEIQIGGEPLAVTMRTPGHDFELAAGFLYSEGIARERHELEAMERVPGADGEEDPNRVRVRLSSSAAKRRSERGAAPREFRLTSACGLCGKPSLEELWQRIPTIEPLEASSSFLARLPERMRLEQRLFMRSGGVHAAALFLPDGTLLSLYEDIGRHNALDKLIGAALLAGEVPLRGRIVVVSGRVGFELVQKALVAAVPVLAGVGAASSLGVDLASLGGLNLYSFVGSGSGNLHLREGERIEIAALTKGRDRE